MKKNFRLTQKKHKPERVIEQIKGDVRKYMKRERRKELPVKMHFWRFDCKFGFDEEEPVVIHEAEIAKYIDQAAEKGCEKVYIEILAEGARRVKKAKASEGEEAEGAEETEVTDSCETEATESCETESPESCEEESSKSTD